MTVDSKPSGEEAKLNETGKNFEGRGQGGGKRK